MASATREATQQGHSDSLSDKDRLELYVGLFKYYLELMLKVDIFVAAIVGGIMTFAMTKLGPSPPFQARVGLFMVPAGLALALGVITLRYFRSTLEMHREIKRLGDKLNLTPPPHVHLLVDVTFVSFIAYFFLFLGILYFMFFPIHSAAS
jgi:hypothetical protein